MCELNMPVHVTRPMYFTNAPIRKYSVLKVALETYSYLRII